MSAQPLPALASETRPPGIRPGRRWPRRLGVWDGRGRQGSVGRSQYPLPGRVAQAPAKLLAVLVADTEPRVGKVTARADTRATYWTAELGTSAQVARLAHEPVSARTDQLHLLII